MQIGVTTDAASDITKAEGEKLGVYVVPMYFDLDGESYMEGDHDEAPRDGIPGLLTREKLFDLQRQDRNVTTSQPRPEDVMQTWRRALGEYEEIIHIPMTEGLSGSAQEAVMLSHEDEFEGRVHVVCNKRVSVTQRRAVADAQILAGKGYRAEEICRILERDAEKNSIYLTTGTLKYLKKGGRVTPAAAAIGSILHIQPILSIQKGGRVDAVKLARTPRQGREIMFRELKKDLTERFHDPEGRTCRFATAYSDDRAMSEEMAEELDAAFPNRFDKEIVISPLNLLLCCHTGYGTYGIAAIPVCPETL